MKQNNTLLLDFIEQNTDYKQILYTSIVMIPNFMNTLHFYQSALWAHIYTVGTLICNNLFSH